MNEMKLYTKQGDDGTTGLLGRGRVLKSHSIIHTLGEIDELNAALGIAISCAVPELIRSHLELIQNILFDFGAEVATWKPIDTPVQQSGNQFVAPMLDAQAVEQLEAMIDSVDSQNEPLTEFILPGGNQGAASIHLARAICRRVERTILSALDSTQPIENEAVLKAWINRLGDYLFAAARLSNRLEGVAETKWKKREDRGG